jgi:hypothetical protein
LISQPVFCFSAVLIRQQPIDGYSSSRWYRELGRRIFQNGFEFDAALKNTQAAH